MVTEHGNQYEQIKMISQFPESTRDTPKVTVYKNQSQLSCYVIIVFGQMLYLLSLVL